MDEKRSKILKLSLQGLFLVVVFGIIGYRLVTSWNKIDINLLRINYLWLSISFSLFLIALIGYAFSWQVVMKALKEDLPFLKAVRIWYWSQSARYIPGSVWQIFGRIYLGGKEKISKGKILASVAIETAFLVISSIFVFIVSIPFFRTTINLGRFTPYFAFGILTFGFLHPTIFNKITGFFLHRIDKDNDFRANFKFFKILRMLLVYVCVWVIFGLAFYFAFISLKMVSLSFLPVFIGIFALSWVLGFLFIIAPGGLGAREAVMILMLGLFFSQGTSIVIALFTRALMLIGEILILVISTRF